MNLETYIISKIGIEGFSSLHAKLGITREELEQMLTNPAMVSGYHRSTLCSRLGVYKFQFDEAFPEGMALEDE